MPTKAPTLRRFIRAHFRLWQHRRMKRKLADLKLMRIDLIDAIQHAQSVLDERERRLVAALMEWEMCPDE